MRFLTCLILLFFSININAQKEQEKIKNLKIESILLKTMAEENYLEVTFEGGDETFFEKAYPYPIVKVVLADGRVLESELSYMLTKSVLVGTELTELPENFSCKVSINHLHSEEKDVVIDYVAEVDNSNQFEITDIKFVKSKYGNTLEISIIDNNPHGAFYAYPLFKVEMDGKVIVDFFS